MFDIIHHIAIIGSDYEKSKHFYVDLLGFEIIRENYRKERDDYKIDLACGEQEIELFIIKDAPARVNYPEALGLRHLAFKVKSVDDTVKELNAKGIATEPVRLDDYTGKKMTFFHDPDNLPFSISFFFCCSHPVFKESKCMVSVYSIWKKRFGVFKQSFLC